jgi:hypothetical protein
MKINPKTTSVEELLCRIGRPGNRDFYFYTRPFIFKRRELFIGLWVLNGCSHEYKIVDRESGNETYCTNVEHAVKFFLQ